MVDCRKCRYFIPADKLPSEARRWCEEWVEKYRYGDKLLGYCKARKRPVTYFEGKCRHFRKRFTKQKTLTEVVE